MSFITLGKSKYEQGLLDSVDENFAVISFDSIGNILNANGNFLNALGYKKDEIIGKHHKIFCETSYINSNEYAVFWDNLGKGISQVGEFKRIKKDGSFIWIQASYTTVKDSKGKTTGVIKFAQDITQQKIKTLDYESQLDAISKSQAVIEFDMNGIILKANDNFLNTLGYTLNEIIGKHHKMFCENEYVNSSEYSEFWEKLNRGNFDAGEYLRIGKNNKEIWIQASYNPIFDINGKPYKVVKYATDITSRKNLIFKVKNTSEEFSGSVTNLFDTTQSMSNSAEKTNLLTKEASDSIKTISQGSANVTNKVSSMLSSINSIVESSEDGKNIANDAQKKSHETSLAIEKLDTQSDRIGEVIKVISQIAFQTNILSLNAAVEAATAGEAGKGFAVVAQEVRNLATRSDEAAKEITEAVSNIQNLVKNSLELIKNISEVMKDMSNISNTIADEVQKQGELSNEVSNIMNESNLEIINVSKAMENLENTSNDNGSKATQTLSDTKQLSNLSNELGTLLNQLLNNLDG